jgi:hypothetical protein
VTSVVDFSVVILQNREAVKEYSPARKPGDKWHWT